ncbi:diacylglycerol kinase [Solitalea sp. MAHUQ-68]|uniref:Diacylglycerol kinase n=1 Tax=Solitalea agri TaxID=2953739 RepID=A0A9X2F9T3_9SPHI|nr:diacylglycerol kinase family protein [Solitalea agri]MCO4294468.1 diacylglycerol kinase [Solitalea agri]
MKTIKLIHNPTAGDLEHSKKKLIALIESNGFKCNYASIKKKGWNTIEADTDFIISAGGDGTVRKLTKELLDRKVLEQSWPIALLPLGTANNIAKTLGLAKDTEAVVHAWHKAKIKHYDIGLISYNEQTTFFLESFGFGVFPKLMMEMKKQKMNDLETPEQRIQTALELLHEIIEAYDSRYCEIEIDGTDYSGKYLMAEIMNTRSIGPNLVLSPDSTPFDGYLNVVLVPEKDKNKLVNYVTGKIDSKEKNHTLMNIKAKSVRIGWSDNLVHIDDEFIKIPKSSEVKIELKEGILEFLMP